MMNETGGSQFSGELETLRERITETRRQLTDLERIQMTEGPDKVDAGEIRRLRDQLAEMRRQHDQLAEKVEGTIRTSAGPFGFVRDFIVDNKLLLGGVLGMVLLVGILAALTQMDYATEEEKAKIQSQLKVDLQLQAQEAAARAIAEQQRMMKAIERGENPMEPPRR